MSITTKSQYAVDEVGIWRDTLEHAMADQIALLLGWDGKCESPAVGFARDVVDHFSAVLRLIAVNTEQSERAEMVKAIDDIDKELCPRD